MTYRKAGVVFSLLLTIAVLLTLPSSATAQIESAEEETAAIAPTITTFHFSDRGDDHASRITTDAAGNFYVAAGLADTSQSFGLGVLKYKFSGKLQGAFHYKPAPGEFEGAAHAVKVDAQSNIYVAGNTNVSGLVVSFTSTGVQRWADRFGGSAGNPVALAIDPSGNIYAAGVGGHGGSDGVGPILEWVIVKYSNTGQRLWERHHTGAPNEDSRVSDIQLDALGNALVLGTTSNSPETLTNNMTVEKLDPNGNPLWARNFAIPNVSQVPGGIAIDATGNVYATSTTNPPEGIATPFTVKYDSSGVRQFVLRGNGAGGTSIAIDPAGDILLTGETVGSGVPTFIAATKIHPSGEKVWVTKIGATGKIVSDSTGNIYVAGADDFLTTKLNTEGKIQFATMVLPGDEATDALVDPFGNLLVTGDGLDAQFNHDIFTVKIK